MTLAACRVCTEINNENYLDKGLCIHCAAGFGRCKNCKEWHKKYELYNGTCIDCEGEVFCRQCRDLVPSKNCLVKELCIYCSKGFKRCEDCHKWHKEDELHDGNCSDCAGDKCHVCDEYDNDEDVCTKCGLSTCKDCKFRFETECNEEEWCQKCINKLCVAVNKWLD